MTKYALGFLFSEDCLEVCLIQKNKPAWQKGFLNGVGGKVEENEEPLDAMKREFAEEAGVDITSWHKYSELVDANDEFHVVVYRAFSDKIYSVFSKTDEKIGVFEVKDLTILKTLSNVPWLVQMALDDHYINATITY